MDNIKVGTYYKRERAAYIVDRFLGFDFVPPTVIRVIDGEEGSVQKFILDAQTGGEAYRKIGDQAYKNDMIKLWLFDYIIWNSDRNRNNFLFAGNKVYAIDNGLSFGESYLDSYKSFFDEEIPEEIVVKIKTLLSWDQGIKILSDLLRELLPRSDVKACIARIKKLGKLLEKGRIDSSDELDFDPQTN